MGSAVPMEDLPAASSAGAGAAVPMHDLPDSAGPQTIASQAVPHDDLPPHVLDLTSGVPQSIDPNQAGNLELNPQPAPQPQALSAPQQQTVGAIQGMAQKVGDFEHGVLQPAFQTLQVPAMAIGQLISSSLNPDAVNAAHQRRAQEAAEGGGGLYAQYKAYLDNPVYTGDALEKYMEKAGNYVADSISTTGKWDESSPGFRNSMASVIGGLTPFTSHLAAMGVTAVTDPAMWLSLGASQFNKVISTTGKAAAEIAEDATVLGGATGEVPLKMDPKGTIAYTPSSDEYVSGVLQGGVNPNIKSELVASITMPGTSAPILKIDSSALRNIISKSQADFWSSSIGQNFASKISSSSGSPLWDSVMSSNDFERYGNLELARQGTEGLKETSMDETVIRHATLEGEFPSLYPDVTERMGMPKLNPDQMTLSRQKQAAWSLFDDYAQMQLQKVGIKAPTFKPADLAYQNEVIDKLMQNGTINEHQADLFRQYGFSEDRGFGRALTDEAQAKLRQLDDSSKIFGNSGGLKTTTSSLQEREKLSTFAMNVIKQKQLGITEPFNPNTDQIVMRNFSQNLQLATDAKLVKQTSELYGATLDSWAERIHGANQALARDQQLGMSSSPETMFRAGLEPMAMQNHAKFINDNPGYTGEISANSIGMQKDASGNPANFSKMPGQVWNKFGENFLGENGKDLYYPNSIVEQIDNRFNRPSGTMAEALISKHNEAWAKNALTTVGRITLDTGTSAVVYANQRGSLGALTEASLQAAGIKSRDALGQLFDASPLKSSYLNLFDKSKQAYLDLKMLQDPTTHALVEDFYTGLQGTVKQTGSMDKLLDLWKQGLGAGRPIDYAAAPLKMGVSAVNTSLDLANQFNDLGMFKWLRERGPAVTNIFKEGYFRTLVDRGIEPGQALDMARTPFLDFSGQNPSAVKTISQGIPFFGFQWKSLTRIPELLLERPGIANTFNPYSGYWKKAFEDWTGYSPQDSSAIQQIMPGYPHDPVLGPVLYGTKEMINQKDLVLGMLNKYVAGLAPDSAQNKLAEGFRQLYRMPTPFAAGVEALNSLNPFKAHDPGDFSFAPFIKSALALVFGIDPYSGDKLKFDKAPDLYLQQRILTAASQMNPFNYSKIWNGIRPYMGQAVQAYADHIKNFGESSEWANTAIGKLLGRTPQEKDKISTAAIKALSNMGTLGLGYLTPDDLTFRDKTLSILRDAKDTLRAGIRDPSTVKQGAASYKFQMDMATRNSKAYLDYKARSAATPSSQQIPQINFNPEGIQ